MELQVLDITFTVDKNLSKKKWSWKVGSFTCYFLSSGGYSQCVLFNCTYFED